MRHLLHGLSLSVTIAICANSALAQQSSLHSRFPTVSKTPKHTEVVKSRLQILESVETALARRQTTLEHFNGLASLIQRQPTDVLAIYLLARCYESAGLLDLSHEQFERLDEAKWKNREGSVRTLNRHLEKDDLQDAFALLPAALEQSPEDATVLLAEAIFQEETGKVKEARACYQDLLRSASPPLGAATRLARMKLADGDKVGALSLVNIDLERNRNYVAAIAVKCQILLQMHQGREAMRLAKQGLSTTPFSRTLLDVAVRAALEAKSDTAALEFALRNLSLADSFAVDEASKKLVANLIQKVPKHIVTQAISDTSNGISEDQARLRFHFDLANVYEKLQMPCESTAQLFICQKLAPDQAVVGWRLARKLETHEHDYVGASKLYARVSASTPKFVQNNAAKSRLTGRLANRQNDVAWRFKDGLTTCPAKNGQQPSSRQQF